MGYCILGCESLECRRQFLHHNEWLHHALGLRAEASGGRALQAVPGAKARARALHHLGCDADGSACDGLHISIVHWWCRPRCAVLLFRGDMAAPRCMVPQRSSEWKIGAY